MQRLTGVCNANQDGIPDMRSHIRYRIELEIGKAEPINRKIIRIVRRPIDGSSLRDVPAEVYFVLLEVPVKRFGTCIRYDDHSTEPHITVHRIIDRIEIE